MLVVMLPVGKLVPLVGKLPFIDLEIPFVATNSRRLLVVQQGYIDGLLATPLCHAGLCFGDGCCRFFGGKIFPLTLFVGLIQSWRVGV